MSEGLKKSKETTQEDRDRIYLSIQEREKELQKEIKLREKEIDKMYLDYFFPGRY